MLPVSSKCFGERVLSAHPNLNFETPRKAAVMKIDVGLD